MIDQDRQVRLHDLLYSCESRDEMCVRVVAMEDLVASLRSDLYKAFSFGTMRASEALADLFEQYDAAIAELGIEVPNDSD